MIVFRRITAVVKKSVLEANVTLPFRPIDGVYQVMSNDGEWACIMDPITRHMENVRSDTLDIVSVTDVVR